MSQPEAPPVLVEVQFWTITLGHGGLMARFDERGRLVEWTPYIRRASHFTSAEAGNAAIRAICRPEIDAAVRAGHAVRELDEETGEVVVMDYSRRHARPLATPALRPGLDRSLGLDAEDAPAHLSSRRLTRSAFRDARRNPTRQTEALISPPSTGGDEYTTPASRRGRLAKMARAYAAG